MASPFSIFRRNQKIMLAVVGIGAMFAFVFLQPLMSYLGGGGTRPENPVVVETDYGNFTQYELDNLRFSRELVDRFLQQVTGKVATNQIRNGLDARWLDTIAQRQYQFWQQRLMGRWSQGPEQAAIETLVLSRRAEQMGMVISDQAINDVLKELTADSVTPEELQEIIRALQPTKPISVGRLFEAIRTEMMASEYAQMFFRSLRDVPPAQRFEYYAQLNRRAKAEVMPLAVADFVDQVPDPANDEIKKFYEKYKNDFPNPDSPEPGFKEPKRASFQYFRANLDEITKAIEPEITAEEISKYYEANKAQFRAVDFDKEDAPGEKPAEDSKPEGTEPAEEKPSEPAESPEAGKPEAEKPADAASDEKPASDAPSEPKPDEQPENPQSSRARRTTPVRLASTTVAQDDQPPAEEKPAEEEPVQEKPAEEKPAEDKPAEETPAQDKPAEEAAPGTDEKPAEEVRYEPLEKVQDTIRTTLARQKAEQRITEQFDQLSGEMRRYTHDLDIYTTEKGANPNAKAPTPLNFAEMAKGTDVQALELKSVTAAQAAEEPLGKSFRVAQNPRTQMPFAMPFVTFAFAETLPTYKAEMDQDNENNIFLFWKTDEEPAYVPPLDQIRDKVVRAWKMTKARELAKKRAEEFAVQARTLKKPLAELFSSQSKLKVAEVGPFSWLTLGNVPAGPGAQPRLSEVEGVDLPGEAFMEAVFHLEPAGVGVALNEPQDTAYVIRLVEFEPPLDELRDDFARTQPDRYMSAAVGSQREIFQAWLADLNDEAGVHWFRQADTRRTGDEEQTEF